MNILEKAYKKHKTWIAIVKSFGLDEYHAEDIVQEMYLKVHEMTEKGKDLSYNKEEINYYYVFKILYTMFLQMKKKQNKFTYGEDDLLYNVQDSEKVHFESMEKKFNEEFKKLHWYDQRVFEIVTNGTKIAELSRKTQITYISLYNTYTRVKALLKKKLDL